MKKFVFVLMPFNDDFDDIYKLGIKAACNSEKVYCERVDEQVYEGSMLDRIYNQIQHSDYIIADMSTQNPNVFYEVGYAHALQKKVILITQEESDIPFDLKHYYHIIYNRVHLSELNQKIRNRIEWYLANPDLEIDINLNPVLQVYINGTLLKEKQENFLKIPVVKQGHKFTGTISFLLVNPTTKIFSFSERELHVIFSRMVPLKLQLRDEASILPEGMLLFSGFTYKHILPYSYAGKNFDIEVETEMSFEIEYYGEIIICSPDTQLQYQFNFQIVLDNIDESSVEN